MTVTCYETIENMRTFARNLTLREGGKVNLPIGQVAEVLRLTLEMLAAAPSAEVEKLLLRVRKRRAKLIDAKRAWASRPCGRAAVPDPEHGWHTVIGPSKRPTKRPKVGK